jgi:hypothetical protein
MNKAVPKSYSANWDWYHSWTSTTDLKTLHESPLRNRTHGDVGGRREQSRLLPYLDYGEISSQPELQQA